MELAGIEAQQVVLLLEDYQFVHSTFLEMINSLLSSGEVNPKRFGSAFNTQSWFNEAELDDVFQLYFHTR